MSDSIDLEEYFDAGGSADRDAAELLRDRDTDAEFVSLTSNSDDCISEIVSIRSDAVGGGNISRGLSKSISFRKHQSIVHKLRAEIAVLQDSLSKTDFVDVQTLHTKLRTSMLDLKRVKTLNFEMKDRVQLLENRLHEALQREMLLQNDFKAAKSSGSELDLEFADPIDDNSLLSTTSSSCEATIHETFRSLKYQTEIVNSSENAYNRQSVSTLSTPLSSSHGNMPAANEVSVIDEEGINNISSQSLQLEALKRKCQHLERLTASYLERISYLEVESLKHLKFILDEILKCFLLFLTEYF
jgi:hypothetical protein